MPKNKNKHNQEKHRQKVKEKQQRKRDVRAVQVKRANRAALSAHRMMALDMAKFEKDDFVWWMAHAINYMVSDYAQAIWNPLFDLYTINTPAPNIAEIVTKVTDIFGTSEQADDVLSLLGLKADTYYKLRNLVLAKYKVAHPDDPNSSEAIRGPHVSEVWEYFDMLKKTASKNKPPLAISTEMAPIVAGIPFEPSV